MSWPVSRTNLRSEGLFSRPIALILLLVFLVETFDATAHDSLYNYLEIQISDEGRIALEFSVHAADFGAEFGIDPNSQETDWYSNLPDANQQAIRDSANAFLQSSFRVLCEKAGSALSPIDVPKIGADATIDRGARPGSLLASTILPTSINSLKIEYEGVEKRLMIVVTKSGAFPKVHDLAPHSAWQMPIPAKITTNPP